MSFLKKIGRALKGKKKEATFFTKLPTFESETELSKFISRKQEAENAELKVKTLRQQAEIEALKNQMRGQVTEEAIKKEVIKSKDKKKAEEKRRTLKLKFVDITPPTFFLKSNKSFHKLAGIQLQETSDGRLLYYPWLQKKEEKSIKPINLRFSIPAFSFNEFFREDLGIVSQIRGGKVDSNFDITANGKPVLINPESYNDEENNQKVRIIDMSASERKKYDDQLEELKNELSSRYSQLKQEKLKEAQYLSELAERDMRVEVAEKERDTMASKSQIFAEKHETMGERLAIAETVLQDLKQQQLLDAKLVKKFEEGLDKLRDKLGDRLSMRESEVEESKVRRIARDTASEMVRLSGNQKIAIKENNQS